MARETEGLKPLDVSAPNAARIFDYFLGGNANFAADRQVAERLETLVPAFGKWIRLRRAFIQEAALRLYEEGFTQFLDLASGLPTQDHIHAIVPEANVVYSDINPIAVSYGTSHLADLPRVDYIQGDVLAINDILRSAAVERLIDRRRKVAIGLNALLFFLSVDQASALAHALYDWAPLESKIFVNFQTVESADNPALQHFSETFAQAGMPLFFYTRAQAEALLRPWQVERIAPTTEYLGLPADFIAPADRAGVGIELFGVFLSRAPSTVWEG